MYRANCTNTTVITKWFELHQEVLDENGIKSPLRIWNVDECGCIDSPKPKKVVSMKRKKSIQLSSADKGETTTVVTFINAERMHLKPMVIHKGQKVMESWKKDMPAGWSCGATEDGWISKKLFYRFGKQFISYLENRGLLEGQQKHLIIMDSYNSHTFNFQFMKLMNDNNIIVLALPSHTNHLLQPLHDIPFANLKTERYEAIRLFMRAHSA